MDANTWDFVEQLGKAVSDAYWDIVRPWPKGAPGDVEYIVKMLLQRRRAWAAVGVVAQAIHLQIDVGPELILETLEATLLPQAKEEAGAPFSVDVLIQRLQSDLEKGQDVDEERLAGLEWNYLPLLNGHPVSPVTLHRRLAASPAFFAEVIAVLFRSRNEPADAVLPEPSEQDRQRATRAFELLHTWKTVPGFDRERSIVEYEALRTWVLEARRLCEASGRLVVGDIQIGKVLAHAPDESDGNWPCIPVRDLIDEIDSESLADGFVVGTLSKRGVHCKSLIDGGAQERALAARYEKHAIACEIDWPVTAAALRKVAERYERQAGSEDAKAEARRLGR